MGQKKLIRFTEIKTFANVLQYPENIAGNWHLHFKNNNPVILELACGKGEYTLGLAQLYPKKNFIGVDLKGNRIWVGAKKALQQGLENVAFLRIQIDGISNYFKKDEVEEIWIIFPDPQLRISKSKKRLTHPKFLRMYQQILKPGGKIHLKTDSPELYHFTKKVIDHYHCSLLQESDNIYQQQHIKPELKIKTHYELLDIAQSNRIHYLSFSLPPQLPGVEMDKLFHEDLKNEKAV
ncbi:MAG TPA: tRNA (guanosine(46)-N7)-methyltransferase TrmB [Chitinophagaceae bacterium]|nr:tRNA (guanosine(46)-N7)-methyltransferase TrmB [Chitinophagaceae bacterium]